MMLGHDGVATFQIAASDLAATLTNDVALDHGNLTGLGDDDHPQYYNEARADLRYSQIAHTHTAFSQLDITTLRLPAGGGRYVRLTGRIDANGKAHVDVAIDTP